MKKTLRSRLPHAQALLAAIATLPALMVFTSSASAQTLSWSNAGTSVLGVTGTWDTTTAKWWNGTEAVLYSNTTSTNATFAGTAGTLTLAGNGTFNVGTMTVSTSSYIFGNAINAGTLNFSNGFIDIGSGSSNTVQAVRFDSNLAGSLTMRSPNNTLVNGSAIATIRGNNTGLTSFDLNLNVGGVSGNAVYIENAGALGAAGATVKLTSGILVLNTAASYNAWNTEFAGGVLRVRVNVANSNTTYNGNGTLTANSAIATLNNNFLNYAGTMALGDRTLTVAPGTGGNITFSNVISGAGNLTVDAGGSAGSGLGTVTLSAANTFTGVATTTTHASSPRTLALNNVNALQNATLNTGAASGTQTVTFTVAGTNTYNIGALAGSDELAMGANSISIGNKEGSSSFGAVISGTGGLTKVAAGSGTSVQALTANNTYTGATVVTGGTLALSGSGAVNASSGISINGATAKFVASGSSAVTPVVTLTQGTLTGSGTVNTVNVASGSLSNNDGVAGADLTLGTLTVSGAATVNTFSNGANTSAPIAITTFNHDALVTVNAANANGWTNGSVYNLLSFGTRNGVGSFAEGTVSNLSARQGATWNTPSNALTLTIAGDNPRWIGNVDGNWNTSAQNWALVTAGTQTAFLATDDVLFDDNASGSTTIDINAGDVVTNTVQFNNTTKDYTIGGSNGGISAGALVKDGAGKVTLTDTNTYAGGTTINAGTLSVNSDSALGSSSGNLIFGGNGTLETTADITSSRNYVINSNVLGTLNTAESTTLTHTGVISGAGSLVKAGSGTLIVGSAATYTGSTQITAGALALSGAGSLASSSGVANSGTLDISAISGSSTSVAALSGAGNVVLGAKTLSVGSGNTDTTVSGNLSGTGGGLTKTGTGALTLSGNASYTGATTISGGTLRVGSATTFNNSNSLSMSGTGTLDLNGNNATFTNITAGVGTATITNNGTGTGTDTLTLTSATAAFAGLITDGATRATALVVTGRNTTNVNNTFSGGFTFSGESNNNKAFGLGATASTVVDGVVTRGVFGTGTVTLGTSTTDQGQLYMNTVNGLFGNNFIVNTNRGSDVTAAFRVESIGNTMSGNIQANLTSVMFRNNNTGGSAGAGAVTVTGAISSGDTASSGLIVQNPNTQLGLTVTLANVGTPNSYTGNTVIEGGSLATLRLGANNQIPDGAGKGNLVVTAGTFDMNGYSDTVNGLSGAGIVDNVANVGAAISVLTVGGNDMTSNFSGVIRNTTGTVALTKIGTGTLTLSGNNTYSGATTISGGTFELAGSGSINGTSGITVSGGVFKNNSSVALTQALTFTGGTLGGTNLSGVTISVGTGQTVSPGNSPGNMLVGATTFESGGNYNWEVLDANGVAGTGFDTMTLDAGQSLTISATSVSKFNINLWSLSSIGPDVNGNASNFDNTQAYSWTLVATDNTSIASTFSADKFQINIGAFNGTGGFSNALDGGTFSVALSGDNTDLLLTFTPIPEPATMGVLFGLGALGFTAMRRRGCRTA